MTCQQVLTKGKAEEDTQVDPSRTQEPRVLVYLPLVSVATAAFIARKKGFPHRVTSFSF